MNPVRYLKPTDKHDSLTCLAGSMLEFGLFAYNNKPNHAQLAYDTAFRILCRISCVSPFAKFGNEFAENVMSSMLTNRRLFSAPDWKRAIRKTTDEYRALIKFGRECGVLRFGERYPLGRNNEELAALRLADKVGHGKLRDVFYRFHVQRKVTKELQDLYSRFYHPSSDLYG